MSDEGSPCSPHQHLLWLRLREQRERWPMEMEAVVGGFAIDIYIPSLRVAIEVDGNQHLFNRAQRLRDARRDRAHLEAGLMTIRVHNYQVMGGDGFSVERLVLMLEEREAALNQRGLVPKSTTRFASPSWLQAKDRAARLRRQREWLRQMS